MQNIFPCKRTWGRLCFKNDTKLFGKYFALILYFIKESVSWIRCQTCLANIASLNLHKSLKPNPTFNFGWQKTSHFFQWIFLLSPLWSHQIFWKSISISWNRPIGSLKQLIAKVGITWTMIFNKTSFSTCERSFSFHPCNFPQTLSFI